MVLCAGHRVRQPREPELLDARQKARELLATEGAEHHVGRPCRPRPRAQHQDQPRQVGMIDALDGGVGGDSVSAGAVAAFMSMTSLRAHRGDGAGGPILSEIQQGASSLDPFSAAPVVDTGRSPTCHTWRPAGRCPPAPLRVGRPIRLRSPGTTRVNARELGGWLWLKGNASCLPG